MKSGKERRKASRGAGKAKVYSTSKARANFAAALKTAGREHMIIGFGRYNDLIAALVPIDAVRILAGNANGVDPAVREKIIRMARLFFREPARAMATKPSKPRRARGPSKPPARARKTRRRALGKSV
jgi:hypothetical protein